MPHLIELRKSWPETRPEFGRAWKILVDSGRTWARSAPCQMRPSLANVGSHVAESVQIWQNIETRLAHLRRRLCLTKHRKNYVGHKQPNMGPRPPHKAGLERRGGGGLEASRLHEHGVEHLHFGAPPMAAGALRVWGRAPGLWRHRGGACGHARGLRQDGYEQCDVRAVAMESGLDCGTQT